MKENEKLGENANLIVKTDNPSKKPEEKDESSSLDYKLIFYILLILIIFGVLLFFFFYIHYGSYKVEMLIPENSIIKPLVDDRKYRLVKLTNNLEVLLISDISSSISAAALSVGSGSFKDDPNIPGLAHFCEHMIFLGSKTFPMPSQFEDLLSTYFGSTNAFTEDEHTTYYFEVGNAGFDSALKIFSRMFAEPLFDNTLMQKEINAVNSENEKNLNNDNWRQNQLLRELSHSKSVFHRFGTGNNQTLISQGIDILSEKLNNFYRENYIPSNMRLVVSSNSNLDDLQDSIAKFFSDIRTDAIDMNTPDISSDTNNTFTRLPFDKDNLGKIVWYNKLSSSYILDFIFSLDEVITKYKTKPLDYIIYLLKYSGPNSLISVLKKYKLASKLDLGVVTSSSQFSMYAISLTLTEEGFNKLNGVIDLTYTYLNLMRESKIDQDTYREIYNISKIEFKFLEKKKSYGDYLSSLAINMFQYSDRDIIYGDYTHSNFDENIIQDYIKSFRPDNAIVMIGSPLQPIQQIKDIYFKNTKNQTEPWYGTNYMQQFLSKEYIKYLMNLNNTENFVLRRKNIFITSETTIKTCLDENPETCKVELNSTIPSLFYDSQNIKIWHKTDRTFLIPKENFYLNFVFPSLRTNVTDFLNVFVYFNYVKYRLNTILADAGDAGNDIAYDFNENGITIFGSTYSDVTEVILNKIFNTILESSYDVNSFNQVLEISLNSLKETENAQPYLKAKALFTKMIKRNVFIYTDLLTVIGSLNYNIFSSRMSEIKKYMILTSLFYGNIETSTLERIRKFLVENISQIPVLKYNIESLHYQREITGSFIFRTTNDLQSELNGIIENFYQIGYRDLKRSIATSIIELCWGNLFYYQLRTMQQLGYIVASTKNVYDSVMYFIFVVQGSAVSPDLIDRKIDDVLLQARNIILNLKQYQFNSFLLSIRNELLAKDTNLKERSDRIWKEISENSYEFNRRELLLKELDSIKKEEVLNIFDEIFINNPKKISIQIFPGSAKLKINDITEDYYLNKNLKTLITTDLNTFYSMPTLTKGLYMTMSKSFK